MAMANHVKARIPIRTHWAWLTRSMMRPYNVDRTSSCVVIQTGGYTTETPGPCPPENVISLQAVHGWMASPVYLSTNCHCVLSQMQDLTKEPQVLNSANPDKPRPRSEFYETSCTMPRPTG